MANVTERRILQGLALSIGAITAIGFVFYLGITRLIDDTQRVNATHGVIQTLGNFAGQLEEAGDAAVAFALTGDGQLVHTQAAAIARAQQDLDVLFEHLGADAPVLDRLKALKPLLASTISECDRLIRIRKQQGAGPAMEAARAHVARDTLDPLPTEVARLISTQREALARQALDARGSSHAMLLIVASGSLAEVLVAIATALAIRRYVREKRRSLLALQESESRLRNSAQELETARQQADAASAAKSTFLANMSHEIRTPVTAILGYADLVLEPAQTSSDRHDSLQVIRRSAKHLLDLINDILDLSKIEAGKMTVESIPCNAAALISEVVSMLRPRAHEKRISLRLEFDGPIPDRIQSDPLRIKQVLTNLLGNAVKFTNEGEVVVTVRCAHTGDGGTLHIEVRDTGIGISAEQMRQIFRPFTQADGTMSRRFGGTGLGLTISKSLAVMLGGDVTVASEQGRGSVFTFSVAAGDLRDVNWIHGLTETTFASQPDPSGGKPLHLDARILLAEDGKDNQRLICHHLSRAGARVSVADNGRIALEMAQAERFDLILMDMQMPELDGYGATRELRKRGFTVPIVALTAHAMSGDREKCLAAGCTDYLTKPIDRNQLLWTLASHLDKASPGAAPTAPSPPAANSNQPLRSEFVNDAQMRELVQDFVGELPAQVAQLATLLDEHQTEDLRRVVHQLKGAGGGYGFGPITTEAARAEQLIKNNEPLDAIERSVQGLIQLIRRVEGYRPELENTPCPRKS